MNTTKFKFLVSVAIAGLLPLTAAAQSLTEDTGVGPSHRFGDSGQLAISSDAALSIVHTTPGDVTTVTLAPAVDYFITDRLSIGGFISLDHVTVGDYDATTFGIGPRIGYDFTLSDSVSIWPKAGLSISSTSVSEEVDVDGDVELEASRGNDGLALNLFVPIMFHPATHFFAGFGPFLDVDLTGEDKVTRLGGRLTLGGWVVL